MNAYVLHLYIDILTYACNTKSLKTRENVYIYKYMNFITLKKFICVYIYIYMLHNISQSYILTKLECEYEKAKSEFIMDQTALPVYFHLL